MVTSHASTSALEGRPGFGTVFAAFLGDEVGRTEAAALGHSASGRIRSHQPPQVSSPLVLQPLITARGVPWRLLVASSTVPLYSINELVPPRLEQRVPDEQTEAADGGAAERGPTPSATMLGSVHARGAAVAADDPTCPSA
eukprot:6493005-Pyramimonas_sp.AAC.1